MKLLLYNLMLQAISTSIFLLILFPEIKCSVVLDSLGQQGIKYSDYCPKTQYCKEGAHVMCMFYDPKRRYGPRCHDPRNVTVTEEIVITILEITNAIRSKAARGLEYGKDKVKLPRAYGMMRLNWDSELATFAQVSVDRCHLRHDLCRATKRFPNPAQMATQVRFQYPSWKYLHQSDSTDGLTHEKVMYAVKRPLRNFFLSKDRVLPDMITSYPDFEINPRLASARAYLDMVHSQSTHIGCALSGYVDFFLLPPDDSRTEVYYNVVAMICNISAKPIKGSSVYNTTPPTGTGYSVVCGCPPGTIEDEDCLCNEKPAKPLPKQAGCSKDKKNCKLPVFILPIITIEDAPPSKLQQKSMSRSLQNETFLSLLSVPNKPISKGIFEMPATGTASRKSDIGHVLDEIIKGAPTHSKISHLQTFNPVVRNHYYEKKPLSPNIHQSHFPRPSIFSRSSIFELPAKKGNNQINSIMKNVINTVSPRKNFTYAKKLLHNYLIKSKKSYHPKTWNQPTVNFESTTRIFLNNPETKLNNISNTNDDNKNKYSTNCYETNNITGEMLLLTLLDKLEKEIKYTDLHGYKKELIDAKIHKIYNTLHTKPEGLISDVDNLNIKTSQNYLQPNFDHKSEHTVERKQGFIGLYEPKYNIDYNQRLSSLEYRAATERNNHIITDVNDQYTDNGFRYRKDRLFDYNDYDFRPVSIDKSHSSLGPKENRHYSELRNPDDGDSKYGLRYERNDRRELYNETYHKYKKIKNPIHNQNEEKDNISYFAHKNILDNDDNLLSFDRNMYYQNKLEKIEKKIKNAGNSNHQEISERPIRPIETPQTNYEVANRPSRLPLNHLNPLYIQDRARVLHGF